MNTFELDRRIATIELLLPQLALEQSKSQAEKYGLDFYAPKFHGRNPLTGLPCTVVFNEPVPGRSSVMNWNTLTKCWFYSKDAGLTWERVDTKEDFIKHLDRTGCLMDTDIIPEFIL
jgi:hypothetical protein